MEKRNYYRPHPHTLKAWLLLLILIPLFFPINAFSKSILWKSEKNGHTLYIMGSIHVLKQSHYPLASALEKAYNNSDIIAFETDITQMADASTQQQFMKKGLLQKQTLQNHISKETYEKLDQYLQGAQLNPDICNKMKPPLCAITITMLEMQRLGFKSNLGLDKYFTEKARKDGKKITALETIEFQINLFFNQNITTQELFLQQTLSEVIFIQEAMEEINTAWKNGESATLQAILLKNNIDFPEFHTHFVLQRNRKWAPKIIQLHKNNKTTLIVVGTAHLLGKGSVIELLEKQGFNFEQL